MFANLSPVKKALVFTALGGLAAAAIGAVVQLPDIKIGTVFIAFTVTGGAVMALGFWLWESIMATSITAPEECRSSARDLAALRRIEAAQAARENEAAAIARTGAPTKLLSARRAPAPATNSLKRYSASGRLMPRGLGDR